MTTAGGLCSFQKCLNFWLQQVFVNFETSLTGIEGIIGLGLAIIEIQWWHWQGLEYQYWTIWTWHLEEMDCFWNPVDLLSLYALIGNCQILRTKCTVVHQTKVSSLSLLSAPTAGMTIMLTHLQHCHDIIFPPLQLGLDDDVFPTNVCKIVMSF